MHSAPPAQHLVRPRAPSRLGPPEALPAFSNSLPAASLKALPTFARALPAPARSLCAFSTVLRALLFAVLCLAVTVAFPPARAADRVEVTTLDLSRDEDGVFLSYAVDFELSPSVEDALTKGVPLYFVAEAQIYRDRWYWRDRRVAEAVRTWRVVYQPLTSSYRVTFGGFSQSYTSRAEAIAAISRGARWKIAEPGQVEEGARHYVEFSYRLDTALLPRPMQIGVASQADWQLKVERTLRLN
ncbi:MAG: DUF4390 domain-containing protein [Rhizobacter sp.]